MNKNAKRFVFTLFFVVWAYFMIKIIPNASSTITSQIEMLKAGNNEEIVNYINSFGSYKIFISLYFMMLQAVVADIMATHIIFANNDIFGWQLGSFISWSGSMIGTTISFYLARNLLYSIIHRFISDKHLKLLNNYMENYGPLTILMVKLSKIFYFDIITYLAGISSMRYKRFFFAVAIGQLISTTAISYNGSIQISENLTLFRLCIEYLLPICIFIFIVFKKRKDKKEKIKKGDAKCKSL